ncbi:hypothetical protein BpHYR1_003733 [Brachionus plicatilis]|uniref:Uncharacterized protein n=1 Tax=Brachionus plicatilis TaxID=10195 RepID=A0A3M7QT94_BRAPC|nr:hypothetical protein BpHYR1_003733 [Brachionus plicatilis]
MKKSHRRLKCFMQCCTSFERASLISGLLKYTYYTTRTLNTLTFTPLRENKINYHIGYGFVASLTVHCAFY